MGLRPSKGSESCDNSGGARGCCTLEERSRDLLAIVRSNKSDFFCAVYAGSGSVGENTAFNPGMKYIVRALPLPLSNSAYAVGRDAAHGPNNTLGPACNESRRRRYCTSTFMYNLADAHAVEFLWCGSAGATSLFSYLEAQSAVHFRPSLVPAASLTLSCNKRSPTTIHHLFYPCLFPSPFCRCSVGLLLRTGYETAFKAVNTASRSRR